jgi:hypothetical protein
MAFKKNQQALRVSGYRVSPDEMDMVRQYIILNPSVSATYVGTSISASPVAITAIANRLDYPRNLLLSVTGVAGGMGGTAVINGKDQFGNIITESIGFGSAAGGGTVAGTKVFATYTDGTFTPQGLGGTALATVNLGVAIGTSSTSPIFGLPDKLGGTSDIKAVTWIDADTAKQHGAASHADVANSAVRIEVAGGIAAADSFVVTYKPTFVNEEEIQKL